MDLISLIIVVAVIGVVLWVITTYIPMPQPIRTILVVIVALILCVWLLQAVGIGHATLHLR